MEAELVFDARNATGESPVWHAAEQALYWVDIPARQLHRLAPSTGAHTTWTGDDPGLARGGSWSANYQRTPCEYVLNREASICRPALLAPRRTRACW